MGVVVELPPRVCAVTGKRAIVWEVTDRIVPLELTHRPSRAERDAGKSARYANLVEVLVRWMSQNGHDKLAAWTRLQAQDIETHQ